jgi:hypothetical protein
LRENARWNVNKTKMRIKIKHRKTYKIGKLVRKGKRARISDTRGKDLYWSPTRRSLVGDQNSFSRVTEIFPSCPLTGVRSFIHIYSALTSNGYRKSIKAVRRQRNLGLSAKVIPSLVPSLVRPIPLNPGTRV